MNIEAYAVGPNRDLVSLDVARRLHREHKENEALLMSALEDLLAQIAANGPLNIVKARATLELMTMTGARACARINPNPSDTPTPENLIVPPDPTLEQICAFVESFVCGDARLQFEEEDGGFIVWALDGNNVIGNFIGATFIEAIGHAIRQFEKPAPPAAANEH